MCMRKRHVPTRFFVTYLHVSLQKHMYTQVNASTCACVNVTDLHVSLSRTYTVHCGNICVNETEKRGKYMQVHVHA